MDMKLAKFSSLYNPTTFIKSGAYRSIFLLFICSKYERIFDVLMDNNSHLIKHTQLLEIFACIFLILIFCLNHHIRIIMA
jgi:hypothetical protein